jgi:threonine dehydratase
MTHAYDQPEVVAGAGTLAREIEAQGGRPDSVLVSVGGGGLIGGVAAWFEQRCRVVALEPEGAPTLFRAREAGSRWMWRWAASRPIRWAPGASAPSPGQVTQQHVNDALLLPDDAILRGAALALEGNEAGGGARRRAGPGGAADRRLPAACGRNGGADSLWRQPGSGKAGLSPSGSKPVRWGRSTKIGGC